MYFSNYITANDSYITLPYKRVNNSNIILLYDVVNNSYITLLYIFDKQHLHYYMTTFLYILLINTLFLTINIEYIVKKVKKQKTIFINFVTFVVAIVHTITSLFTTNV